MSNSGFSYTTERKDNQVMYKCSGVLDERAKWDGSDADGAANVALDMAESTLVNSIGIQTWLKFLRGLAPGCKVTYQACGLRVVNQLNLFSILMTERPTRVASFQAPYECEACDETQIVNLSPESLIKTAAGFDPPQRTCPKCSKPMVFAAIAAKYFLFVQKQA